MKKSVVLVFVFMLLVVAIGVASAGPAVSAGPVVCPETLVPGPTEWWYETEPPFSGVDEIRMVVVLRNEDPFARDLTFDDQTFQLWSSPGVINPPLTAADEPFGLVPYQSNFTYDLTIDVSSLPLEDNVLGFRPKSNESGTMRPSAAPVVEVTFTCKSAAERAALMSLYDSTDGGSWYENTGWGSDSSYCEWYGVTCDAMGHVQNLDLAANFVLGPIPPEIDGLVALHRLDLSGNLIADPLPEELGNLAQLQILDLSHNEYCFKGCGRSLGGAIPASLGDLSNLQTLDLSDNVLEGVIPDQLGDLAQLQTLDLSGNRFCTADYFTGETICDGGLYGVIPANLSNLSALETLSLQDNKSLCWETIAARSWALTLPLYSGPTDCSYLALTASLHFAKSAGNGNLTFVKSAAPRDGNDFAFDLSGPANPTTPTLLNKWGGYGSGDGEFIFPTAVALDKAGNVYVADSGNDRIQKFLASTFVLDDADPDDGDPVGASVSYDKLPLGRYQVTERAVSGWDLKNLTCTGADSSQVTADLEKSTLTIDLAPEEHITCTFINHLQ